MIDSLIFDLDGTLWDSTSGIVMTWNEVLRRHPEVKTVVTAEDLARNFGLPLEQIARNLFPEEEEDKRQALMKECCDLENEYLAERGGTLYPKLEETLQKLSAKMPLAIVSNCQSGYIEAFLKAHDLWRYFVDKECIGDTGEPKGKNIRLVMARQGMKASAYVGDTQGDCDAADLAGVPFIYAAYGFGNVSHKDYEINAFEELLSIVE